MSTSDFILILREAIPNVISGGMLLLLGAFLRWGVKIDRSLSKTETSLTAISEDLKAVNKELLNQDERLEKVEQAVAFRMR